LDQLKKENANAVFTECDVTDFKQVKKAIDYTVQTFGSLDVALNNAGIGGEASKVGDMPEQAWLQAINVNLNGVFIV